MCVRVSAVILPIYICVSAVILPIYVCVSAVILLMATAVFTFSFDMVLGLHNANPLQAKLPQKNVGTCQMRDVLAHILV
jgi:hypothetical protein